MDCIDIMSECGGIICFQKRHVCCFWPFGALESAAVPFFPSSVYIYVPPCHSPVPNHLFLEPHAADTSVVCCIHGWIP